MGLALLTGDTKPPASAAGEGPEPMNYEAETVTTEGGLEAVAQASKQAGWEGLGGSVGDYTWVGWRQARGH